MTVSIETISGKIISDVSGTLKQQRNNAVINAIREFAKRTDYFRTTEEQAFDATDVLTDENDSLEMALDSQGDGFLLWRLESVFIDGVEKQIAQKEDIITEISDLETIYGSGIVFYSISDENVKLFPFPTDTAFATSTGSINVVATGVFVPGDDITTVSDLFYARWGKAIESGAKAELMMMVGKPWTNPQMAGVHAMIFDTAINRAIRKRNLEDAGGELLVEKISFI